MELATFLSCTFNQSFFIAIDENSLIKRSRLTTSESDRGQAMNYADAKKRFVRILKQFHAGMLVTRSEDGSLHSRPMIVADIADEKDVYFVTKLDSGKVDEIKSDPTVNVSFQGGNDYLSLSGQASCHHDPAKLRELWNEAWKVWFPDGPDDPEIVLIKVDSQCGEYWDNSGLNLARFLFETGTAYFTGTTPDFPEEMNQKVAL